MPGPAKTGMERGRCSSLQDLHPPSQMSRASSISAEVQAAGGVTLAQAWERGQLDVKESYVAEASPVEGLPSPLGAFSVCWRAIVGALVDLWHKSGHGWM